MIKIKLNTALLSTLLAAPFALNATADVIKVTDSATLQQQKSARYFSQSGISGEKSRPVETAGADMALSIATRLIIPDSWVIKPSGGYESALVSWKGGLSWPLILRNIAENEGIYVSLDWVAKTATIHVPGKTETENNIASQSSEILEKDRQEFRRKQRQNWERRSDIERQMESGQSQLVRMMETQKASREANQEFIARLNENNAELEEINSTLKKSLENERQQFEELKEKYSVIDPSLKEEKSVDPTKLFGEFEKLWVKPFDDSFDYYVKGGHSDYIETHTPATYIAKPGSVELVLNKWSDTVGWHIDYRAGVQHFNPYQVTFKGSFIESSTELVSIFKASKRPLNIEFFPDVTVPLEDGTVKKGLAIITDLNYR
jgi:hypothetical protein